MIFIQTFQTNLKLALKNTGFGVRHLDSNFCSYTNYEALNKLFKLSKLYFLHMESGD